MIVKYLSSLKQKYQSLKVRSDASSPSFSGHSMTKSQRFDLDLDEPLAFVHKSSIAIAKNRLNQGRQHSAEVAIQTEREVSVDHDFFVTKTSFPQNQADPPRWTWRTTWESTSCRPETGSLTFSAPIPSSSFLATTTRGW